MTNKIGKKRKITFWTRLGFGMGGMLNSGALTFTHSYMVLFLSCLLYTSPSPRDTR